MNENEAFLRHILDEIEFLANQCAEEIGVEPREVHIRKMKRKWASCSSKGRLTFDASLLDETNEVRSRTILHELLHLKYPNHGRLFNILLNIYLKRKAEEYTND